MCNRLGELFIFPLDRFVHVHLLEGVLFIGELFEDFFDGGNGACFRVGGGVESASRDHVRGEVKVHFEVFDVVVLDN
jgi:hypothetical protein